MTTFNVSYCAFNIDCGQVTDLPLQNLLGVAATFCLYMKYHNHNIQCIIQWVQHVLRAGHRPAPTKPFGRCSDVLSLHEIS